MISSKSLYDLLGVSADADAAAVDRAWAGRRSAADPATRARLDEARSILRDPERARRYAAYRNTPLTPEALSALELGVVPRLRVRALGPDGPDERRRWALGAAPG